MSRGLDLTLAALGVQLAAIPWPRYELRLIDAQARRCRATRYWTAAQILALRTVGFLRARNREGCDVYFRPHAADHSAGYLLLDFDAGPCPLAIMRAAGHTPCVVVETSPGHQQAWVRVSLYRIAPAWATAVARGLAARYGADPASAEWRHLGRLAGFTNRKPARLQSNGLPPWVRTVWHSNAPLALVDDSLFSAIRAEPAKPTSVAPAEPCISSLYHQCLHILGLPERFPTPDWSVADYRVARCLFQQGYHATQVTDVLRLGSPGFPRRHPKPEDYLRRTVGAALASLGA
jgi:hypothetical protein